jgi:hypothetical protein
MDLKPDGQHAEQVSPEQYPPGQLALSPANASTFASESADKSLLCEAKFTFTAVMAATATAAMPIKIFFFIILILENQ